MRIQTTWSEPAATLALIATALACAFTLCFLPRAVAPQELPTLTLPRAEVEAALRADAAAAKRAPTSPRTRELDALLLAQGQAEAQGIEDFERYRKRRKSLELGFATLEREIGAAPALTLRERATEKLEDALGLRLSDADAKAVLGSLPSVLAREGASRAGLLVAPHFVVRTLYKARWNILHGRKPDFSFARVERRAFYGWKALHAPTVELSHRIEALHAYGEAGGSDLEEALGVLLYQLGDFRQSTSALEAAYRRSGTLRLRNYLLAARAAAAHHD